MSIKGSLEQEIAIDDTNVSDSEIENLQDSNITNNNGVSSGRRRPSSTTNSSNTTSTNTTNTAAQNIDTTSNNGTVTDGIAQSIDSNLGKITMLAATLDNIQTNIGSLSVGGEDEKFYYDRKVRPLVDELYFLTQSAQGAAIAAQNMQSNAYAKKKQIRLPIDLSYELIKESFCILEVLKKRNAIYRRIIQEDIKRCGGIDDDCFKSSFHDLDDECYEDLKNYYGKKGYDEY